MPMNKSHNFSRATYYIYYCVQLFYWSIFINHFHQVAIIYSTFCSSFKQSQDSSTVKIAELYCDWLKDEQKVEKKIDGHY